MSPRPAKPRPGPLRSAALAALLVLAALPSLAHAVSFNLVFEAGFPQHKQQAVAAGADLWSQWLVDPHGSTVINVDVRLATPPSGQNWIASANTYWRFDSDSELHIPRSAWKYRDNATSSNMDGIITFSTEANWYTGTDGQTPSGTRDMATIMAHEIGHMLGMAASYLDSQSIWGRFARGQRHLQEYDTFLRDQHGNAPTPGTGSAFDVTGDVTFVGQNAVDALGQPIPIYAPDPFQQGSSLSHPHLPAQRALMHYASTVGQSMHGLYDYERGMFQDLQWIFNEPAQLHVMLRNTFPSSGSATARWHNGAAWDFGLPPVDTTAVHIHMPDAPGDYIIDVTRPADAASLAIGGTPNARARLVVHANGSLQVHGDARVGDRPHADARLSLSPGAAMHVHGSLSLATDTDASASLTVGSAGDGPASLQIDGGLYLAGDADNPVGADATLTAHAASTINVAGDTRIWAGATVALITAQLAAQSIDVDQGRFNLIQADVQGHLNNQGEVTVFAQSDLADNYTQHPDSTLHLYLSDPGTPPLAIASHATLAGHLELNLPSELPLYQPTPLLTADGVTGTFDQLLTEAPEGHFLALQYHDDGVDLFAGLIGDMNADGTVNTADVAPFVLALTDPTAYEAAYGLDPALPGDINGDGAFNTADVAPFVQLLTAPGPQSTVPEPTTAALILTLLGILTRRQRPPH